MKKYIILALTVAAASFLGTGCKDWLDINTNPNYATDVEKSSLLPTVQMRTAEKVGYEITLVTSFWNQYIVQCSQTNQYYTIMTNNLQTSASYFTAPWSVFYGQNLPSIKEILNEYGGKDGYENYVVEAKSLLAYNLYLLTSLYDKVCYSESFQTDTYRTTEGNFNPGFDTGEETQKNIIALLKEIRALDPSVVADAEEAHSTADVDMVFGGDVEAWLQFANTLYLKVLLRDFTANQGEISTLLAEGNFLESDAAFDNYENKPDKSNPLYESDQRQLNTTDNIRACNSVLDFMSDSDDRIDAFYTYVPGEDYYNGANYGARGSRYTTSQLKQSATDPVYFSTVDEALFLQAEAYARLGDRANAVSCYEDAVTAAFERVGAQNAAVVLAGDYAIEATATDEEVIEAILTQKWLSNVKGLPVESWFDINRTGYPARGGVINNYSGYLNAGEYPCRFLYSRTSKLYNQNSPAPEALSAPMWWHKK